MQWNDDALSSVNKTPFFLRGMIRKRTEEYVTGEGRSLVTLTDVEELRKKTIQSGEAVGSVTNIGEKDETEEKFYGGLTARQIENIVENTKIGILSNSRFFEVKACGGAFGCPRTLFDVHALADKAIDIIEKSGVPEAVLGRVRGPILKHHKLCVSISGCLNSCSHPQIADFGVQGRARIAIGSGDCNGCGDCLRVCMEKAVTIPGNQPTFDRSRCTSCGDCAAVCSTRAIAVEQYGFNVLGGGKLGRHPKLAKTLFELVDEDVLAASIRVVCDIFINEMGSDERFESALRRIGQAEIRRRATCLILNKK